MKLALCGMPRSGKSTIFAALTSRRVSAGREESNQALLTVPDERVDKLSALYEPEKTIHAQINYIDPAPPVAKPDDPTTRLPVELRQADGLVEVVRNFDAGLGAPRPREDHKKFSGGAAVKRPHNRGAEAGKNRQGPAKGQGRGPGRDRSGGGGPCHAFRRTAPPDQARAGRSRQAARVRAVDGQALRSWWPTTTTRTPSLRTWVKM